MSTQIYALSPLQDEILKRIIETPYELKLHEHAHATFIPIDVCSAAGLAGVAKEKHELALWQLEHSLREWTGAAPAPERPSPEPRIPVGAVEVREPVVVPAEHEAILEGIQFADEFDS